MPTIVMLNMGFIFCFKYSGAGLFPSGSQKDFTVELFV